MQTLAFQHVHQTFTKTLNTKHANPAIHHAILVMVEILIHVLLVPATDIYTKTNVWKLVLQDNTKQYNLVTIYANLVLLHAKPVILTQLHVLLALLIIISMPQILLASQQIIVHQVPTVIKFLTNAKLVIHLV